MATQNINSIDYNELYSQYSWFKNNFPPVVQQTCDEFFLPGFRFEMVGISKNINTLMDKDSYFVTKIRIDKQHDMFFRTSEKAVGIILDRVLGRSNRSFNLNKMTDLEAKIITAFNDYMFSTTAKFLSPPPPTLKRSNFDVVHLTFFIKDIEENKVAKFIITLPDVLLKPDVVTSSGEKFENGDFTTSTIDVKVKVGTTKFSVFDLKNLDIDDIVVFEKSNSSRLVLNFRDYEKEIKINPNLGLVLPVENDGGEDMGGKSESANLWDSIEVEMSAQFDTVKITLGDLKNIEEGLVVDLTSIYDNKVTLSVEDKPIARGELVIVNDRYGVKIDEVIAKEKKKKASSEQPEDEDMEYSEDDENMEYEEEDDESEEGSEGGETEDEEDEFDYSDFELEDEDI